MKAPPFEYVRPKGLPEALALIEKSDGTAKLLAGGQSLTPMLNLRLARPPLLVDISRLTELHGIEDHGTYWRIGAGVTHARIEDESGLTAGGRMIREVAGGIAYRAVRNFGTIGGSLAHADPAADWPLALAALDATILLRSASSERTIPADGFMQAAFTTELRENEIITAVDIPKMADGVRFGYFKFCRKKGEFPEASAASIFDSGRQMGRIFVASLDGAPKALPDLAREVARHGPAACSLEAAEAAMAGVAPHLDEAELRMHAGTLRRAVQRAFD